MRLPNNLGMILLAVWLIVYGAMALLGLNFTNSHIIMGLIALVAGILLLLGR
jgi:hypothetical protein